MTLMGFRRGFRDHNNERPFDPPTPNIVALIPSTPAELPIPELEEPIGADQEMADLIRYGPLQTYRLASLAFGPDFAGRWAAHVAMQRRWDFLRWRHEREHLS